MVEANTFLNFFLLILLPAGAALLFLCAKGVLDRIKLSKGVTLERRQWRERGKLGKFSPSKIKKEREKERRIAALLRSKEHSTQIYGDDRIRQWKDE